MEVVEVMHEKHGPVEFDRTCDPAWGRYRGTTRLTPFDPVSWSGAASLRCRARAAYGIRPTGCPHLAKADASLRCCSGLIGISGIATPSHILRCGSPMELAALGRVICCGPRAAAASADRIGKRQF
jgi:hypothetical protein